MKDKLNLLKQKLMKNKEKLENYNDNKKMIEIAKKLGVEFSIDNLRRLPTQGGFNRFSMDDNNMVYLYPVNDGLPTCPFEFYKGTKLILNNQKVILKLLI